MAIRSFLVRRDERGQTLAAVLKRRLGLSWSHARKLVLDRRVQLAGSICVQTVRRVLPGQRVEVLSTVKGLRERQLPKGAALQPTPDIAIRYQDEHFVVVDKPAGLTTMRHAEESAEFGERARKFLPKTLMDYLPRIVGGRKSFFAVHRLDRDTTGLVVFARTQEAARHLSRQFRAHRVARRYFALVRGRPIEGRVESWFVRDRGDGRRGSGPPGTGKRAITYVRIVESLESLTLVECRLETGRTHQVRIHLGEMGAPICGETIYDRPCHGAPLPDDSGARRVLLHAATLGLEHPMSRVWLEWDSPLPEDMAEIVARRRTASLEGKHQSAQRKAGQ